jgi:predicted phosphate transport protein (TIGR00153 family)
MRKLPFFTNLFAKSPIHPLQEHILLSRTCVQQLPSFFTAAFSEDWSNVESIYNKIAELENQADELKREIRLGIPRTTFLPFSRDDLLELVKAQDEMANTARDIAGIILGRKMTFPKSLQADLLSLVDKGLQAVDVTCEGSDELGKLLQSGFANQGITSLENIIEQLDIAEHEADLCERNLRHALFAIEDELVPVDVMFLYSVLDLVGEIADSAQMTGNRLIYLFAS